MNRTRNSESRVPRHRHNVGLSGDTADQEGRRRQNAARSQDGGESEVQRLDDGRFGRHLCFAVAVAGGNHNGIVDIRTHLDGGDDEVAHEKDIIPGEGRHRKVEPDAALDDQDQQQGQPCRLEGEQQHNDNEHRAQYADQRQRWWPDHSRWWSCPPAARRPGRRSGPLRRAGSVKRQRFPRLLRAEPGRPPTGHTRCPAADPAPSAAGCGWYPVLPAWRCPGSLRRNPPCHTETAAGPAAVPGIRPGWPNFPGCRFRRHTGRIRRWSVRNPNRLPPTADAGSGCRSAYSRRWLRCWPAPWRSPPGDRLPGATPSTVSGGFFCAKRE